MQPRPAWSVVVAATLTAGRCCEQRRLRKWTAGLWCGVWVSVLYSNGPSRARDSRASDADPRCHAISAENNCPCGLHNSYEDLLDEEDDTGIVEQLRANGLVQEAFGTNKRCARLTPQPTCSKCSWCLHSVLLRAELTATVAAGPAGRRHFGVAANFSETKAKVQGPPPQVGQHTREILREAGLTESEIQVPGISAPGISAYPITLPIHRLLWRSR